jgi:hypothetical protein
MTHCGATRQHLSSYMTCCSVITIRVLIIDTGRVSAYVTDLQGPPSERTQTEKIWDLKSLARQYARDRGSCDDTRISYLEYVESEAEADWTLARMIAG